MRWSAFEDEGAEEWEVNTREGAIGSGIRAERIKTWNAEWEIFCEWIVAEFGNDA